MPARNIPTSCQRPCKPRVNETHVVVVEPGAVTAPRVLVPAVLSIGWHAHLDSCVRLVQSILCKVPQAKSHFGEEWHTCWMHRANRLLQSLYSKCRVFISSTQ